MDSEQQTKQTETEQSRLHGSDRIVSLLRQKNWAGNPLGEIAGWPALLVDTLNMMLSVPVPMQFFWGPELLTFYNDAMTVIVGDKHPSALGRPARDVWADAWPIVGEQLLNTFHTGETVRMENASVGGALAGRFFTYTYSPVFDQNGQIRALMNVAQDTTATVLEQQAELARRSADEQLGLAVDAASLAFWFYDIERGVVGGDSRMAALFGLTVREAPTEVWLSAIAGEDRRRVGDEFIASLEQGAPYDTEYRVCVGKEHRWVRAKARLLPESSRLPRMVGLCEDVTERKQAEAALRDTVDRLALAEQIGNIAAWEWDVTTDRLTWDSAGSWVYGRSPEEIGDMEAVARFVHRDDFTAVMKAMQPVLRGEGEFNAEFRACWPDGSHHWLIGKGKPIFDEQGKVTRINGVNIDITERRTAEGALRQSEKLAAVGQLASTIAHEINNPLEAVTNLLYLCKSVTRDPELTSYLSTAEVELRRVAAITSQTLRFHKQSTRPQEVSCTDLFSNALLIFQGRIQNSNIRVEKRKRAGRPVVCLEGEIGQVMNNLIGNALDAMRQGGGRLLVRSAESTDWRTGQKGLRLTVADTGYGMSKKTRSQLFTAFYTTKGINGTGLGLWVSNEIVQRHAGRLTVRSCDTPGRSGTVFNLFLPFQGPVLAE